MDHAHGRLAVLSRHLAKEADRSSLHLTQQACAAQQAVLYARPAGQDTAYGRVGAEQDQPAFARPSKYSSSEDLRLGRSSTAPASDQWQPQILASELVDRYELTVPLPRAGSGIQVGGLSVNLVGEALKVSGYQIRPLGFDMHLHFDPASKRHMTGVGRMTRKEVTQDPFTTWWHLPRDCAPDTVRARRRTDKLVVTIRKS